MIDERFGEYSAGQGFDSWRLGRQDFTEFDQGLSVARLEQIALRLGQANR